MALDKKLGKFFLTIRGGEVYMIDHVINHMIARSIPPDPMALPLKLVNEDAVRACEIAALRARYTCAPGRLKPPSSAP